MTTWTGVTSPFDVGGYVLGLCWSPDLGLFVAIGASADGTVAIATSPDGVTWTARGNPFSSGGGGTGFGVTWSPTLGLFVAAGNSNDGSIGVCTSPDGVTWTSRGNPWSPGGQGFAVAWSEAQAQFVAVGQYGTANMIQTSPDGVTWTGRTSAFDGNYASGVCYSPALDLWLAVGNNSPDFALTSPDGITWTVTATGTQPVACCWCVTLGLFVIGSGGTPVIQTSPDGSAWTSQTTPFDAGFVGAIAEGKSGSVIAVGSNSAVTKAIMESTDAVTWTVDSAPVIDTLNGADAVAYAASLELGAAGTYGAVSDAIVVASFAPPPPPAAGRTPAPVGARIIITDLYGDVTTWLGRANVLNATWTANLDLPSSGTIDVRSGDIAVNTIFAKDGDPLIAESNRLAYIFLNEKPGPVGTVPQDPWVCRGAGILMSPQDQADADVSTTHFTFYDPWQWLMGIPCFLDDIGTPIGQAGRNFFAVDGSEIAATLLSDSILSLIALGYAPLPGPGGLATMIDMPSPYYTSGFYTGGGINATPSLNWNVQQGTTVGQAWQNLASAGNDIGGTAQCIDIIIEPIWDPVNRPGYTSQLAIYNLAGTEQPIAPMAWGRFNQAATTADREHDGTPTSFVNVAQFYAGPGGQAGIGTIEDNPPSIAKYYSYWSQQYFPGQPNLTAVNAYAVQTVQLQGQGKRTFTVNPDPLRAALPFRDYNIGDRIPIYSTNGQRVGASGYQRVESIPLVINSDGATSVQELLTSPDWPQDTGT